MTVLDAGKANEVADAKRRGTTLYLCQNATTGNAAILAQVVKPTDGDGTITLIGTQAPGARLAWDDGTLLCDCRHFPAGAKRRFTEIKRP